MKSRHKPPAEERCPDLPALSPLKKWPTACDPTADCKIGSYWYRAPSEVGPEAIQDWIDFTEKRLATEHSLLMSLVAAGLSAFFVLATASVTIDTRLVDIGALGVRAVVAVVTLLVMLRITLPKSEQAPLEQRWLLYRQRARTLAAIPLNATESLPPAGTEHISTKAHHPARQPARGIGALLATVAIRLIPCRKDRRDRSSST